MRFSRIKGRSLPRSATATISKGTHLAFLLCGLLGIASVVLVSSGTMASPNATGSNRNEASGVLDRYQRKDFAIKVVGVGTVGMFCALILMMADVDDPRRNKPGAFRCSRRERLKKRACCAHL